MNLPHVGGPPDFVEMFKTALEHSGAPPDKLKLELTESILVRDIEGLIAKMEALAHVGVGFSLDDFGTGYSSLKSGGELNGGFMGLIPISPRAISISF